jgi:tetratricopeptide (TPR) repeat protein
VHGYEIIDRPMLGWPYSWGFRRSAPNLPHAQHMQAHLAMRLGRWKEALNCTRESIRLSFAGYPELDREHHLNILCWALGHEGCFKEAVNGHHSKSQDNSWPRMLRLKLDDARLAAWAQTRIQTVGDGLYYAALADLDQGHWQAAQEKLDHFNQIRNTWYGADLNAWRDEVDARVTFESGHHAKGLEEIRSVARWVDGTSSTSAEACRWGQGSYYDDLWGETALRAGNLDEALEAFSEGLAHEHGSIVSAVGLQVVWERKQNPNLVKHYARRGSEIWDQADPGALANMQKRMRAIAAGQAEPF